MRRSTSRRSSSGEASRAGRRGFTTISHRGAMSPSRRRNCSRSRRLARFRRTAIPKARGTVNPMRGPCVWSRSSAKRNAAKYGPVNRCPFSYTRRKSVERRMRALFGSLKLLCVADGSLVAHGELVTAFGAPPGQHGTAVLRFHANPEPVSFGPLTIVRLKCTFRHLVVFGVPQRSG